MSLTRRTLVAKPPDRRRLDRTLSSAGPNMVLDDAADCAVGRDVLQSVLSQVEQVPAHVTQRSQLFVDAGDLTIQQRQYLRAWLLTLVA